MPGLELVLLEEGRNYVSLLHRDRGILFWKTNERQEPQNAAVGEFDPTRQGLEIWCRSRYNTHQKPWVLDARGEIIASQELESGNCFVNEFVRSDPRLPFGGVKDSGYGRELSHFGIKEFVNIKTVYVK